jgi:hypothetical protein
VCYHDAEVLNSTLKRSSCAIPDHVRPNARTKGPPHANDRLSWPDSFNHDTHKTLVGQPWLHLVTASYKHLHTDNARRPPTHGLPLIFSAGPNGSSRLIIHSPFLPNVPAIKLSIRHGGRDCHGEGPRTDTTAVKRSTEPNSPSSTIDHERKS